MLKKRCERNSRGKAHLVRPPLSAVLQIPGREVHETGVAPSWRPFPFASRGMAAVCRCELGNPQFLSSPGPETRGCPPAPARSDPRRRAFAVAPVPPRLHVPPAPPRWVPSLCGLLYGVRRVSFSGLKGPKVEMVTSVSRPRRSPSVVLAPSLVFPPPRLVTLSEAWLARGGAWLLESSMGWI